MALTTYDNWMGTQISGYPSVVVDRREVWDPSDIFSVYNNQKNYYGWADMTMANATFSGSNVTIPVTVTPANPMVGDYRLALVITEDNVHGTTSSWDQHNYYSNSRGTGDAGNGLASSEYNFDLLGDPVPAAQVKYNFVGRSITPGVTGTAGTLPSSMTAGTAYPVNLTATLDPSWDRKKLHAVVMLIANSNGAVLNSVNTRWTLGVSNVTAGINKFEVFPNPTSANATAQIELAQATSVSIQVTDMMGRTVLSVPAAQMSAGTHQVNLPVNELASGLYNVQIQTAAGTAVERLNVVK